MNWWIIRVAFLQKVIALKKGINNMERINSEVRISKIKCIQEYTLNNSFNKYK